MDSIKYLFISPSTQSIQLGRVDPTSVKEVVSNEVKDNTVAKLTGIGTKLDIKV